MKATSFLTQSSVLITLLFRAARSSSAVSSDEPAAGEHLVARHVQGAKGAGGSVSPRPCRICLGEDEAA